MYYLAVFFIHVGRGGGDAMAIMSLPSHLTRGVKIAAASAKMPCSILERKEKKKAVPYHPRHNTTSTTDGHLSQNHVLHPFQKKKKPQ